MMSECRVSSLVSLFAILVSWCTGYSFRSAFLYGVRPSGTIYSRSHAVSPPKAESESILVATGVQRNSALMGLGGKIVVAGIDGSNDEDEFILNLLNEQVAFPLFQFLLISARFVFTFYLYQAIWDSVTLVTSDVMRSKKQLLTRSARYSGLLNVLAFEEADPGSPESMKKLLKGANACIAMNICREFIVSLSNAALDAGVKRLVITTSLEESDITTISEFEKAQAAFSASGGAFTGVRHGKIVAGNEDNSYEIVNSTAPCLDTYIERGVLGRVVAELLSIDMSVNNQCGVSSSGSFSAAYLSVLRSSGLSRNEEVTKMFSGALQKVARRTGHQYKSKMKIEEEDVEVGKHSLGENVLETMLKSGNEEKLQGYDASTGPDGDDVAMIFPKGCDEEEDSSRLTDEQKVTLKTEAILKTVYAEYDARMVTKQTSRSEFYDLNREKAMILARMELDEEKSIAQRIDIDIQNDKMILDRFEDQNRKQYSKLIALERKEMQNQKDISDTWVKYIYVLLEVTMFHCRKENILFHNEDTFSQTLLLRKKANELRTLCGLPPFEVVYDPVDAVAIVHSLADQKSNVVLGVPIDVSLNEFDKILTILDEKYAKMLKNIPALRGASQIIELAVETLEQELPQQPPSVNDIRRTESSTKKEKVSEMRLQAIQNRGKPTENNNPVGKL